MLKLQQERSLHYAARRAAPVGMTAFFHMRMPCPPKPPFVLAECELHPWVEKLDQRLIEAVSDAANTFFLPS